MKVTIIAVRTNDLDAFGRSEQGDAVVLRTRRELPPLPVYFVEVDCSLMGSVLDSALDQVKRAIVERLYISVEGSANTERGQALKKLLLAAESRTVAEIEQMARLAAPTPPMVKQV